MCRLPPALFFFTGVVSPAAVRQFPRDLCESPHFYLLCLGSRRLGRSELCKLPHLTKKAFFPLYGIMGGYLCRLKRSRNGAVQIARSCG